MCGREAAVAVVVVVVVVVVVFVVVVVVVVVLLLLLLLLVLVLGLLALLVLVLLVLLLAGVCFVLTKKKRICFALIRLEKLRYKIKILYDVKPLFSFSFFPFL